MIPYDCPHCEHHMELPDEFAGERATCTRCGIPFAVPEGPAEDVNASVWAEVYGQRTSGDTVSDVPASREARTAEPADGPELPDWVNERLELSQQRLGPYFWTLAYFMPPAALLWALLLPIRHPQKKSAIVMPLVWMMVLGGIGFAGAYLTPMITEQLGQAEAVAPDAKPAMQSGSAEPAAVLRPGYINVATLQPGEMYRVMKKGVPIQDSPSEGDGVFQRIVMYELPVGGIFQVVRVHRVQGQAWYQVIVTDGRQNLYMWINFRNLSRAGIEPVAPPTLAQPIPPLSAPIRRLF